MQTPFLKPTAVSWLSMHKRIKQGQKPLFPCSLVMKENKGEWWASTLTPFLSHKACTQLYLSSREHCLKQLKEFLPFSPETTIPHLYHTKQCYKPLLPCQEDREQDKRGYPNKKMRKSTKLTNWLLPESHLNNNHLYCEKVIFQKCRKMFSYTANRNKKNTDIGILTHHTNSATGAHSMPLYLDKMKALQSAEYIFFLRYRRHDTHLSALLCKAFYSWGGGNKNRNRQSL